MKLFHSWDIEIFNRYGIPILVFEWLLEKDFDLIGQRKYLVVLDLHVCLNPTDRIFIDVPNFGAV